MSALQSPAADAVPVLIAQLVEGWNTKNAAGFAQPFTEDADFVAINGTHIQWIMKYSTGALAQWAK
jgi:uncharacterized protein (TIGR02246 family)